MRHLTIVLGLCLAATAIVYSAETSTFTDAQRSFWSLQLRETALLVLLAGVLIGFCFWRLGRDVS